MTEVKIMLHMYMRIKLPPLVAYGMQLPSSLSLLLATTHNLKQLIVFQKQVQEFIRRVSGPISLDLVD